MKTVTRYVEDEWDETICDACGHAEQYHHDGTQNSFTDASHKMLRINGCVVERPPNKGGIYHGTNPYARCPCKAFV